MANDYYNASGAPATRSQGSSSVIRGEYNLLVQAFNKLPGLSDNGGRFVRVNSGGTALEAVTASKARTGLGIGSMATRDVTISTDDPSGEPADGDFWVKYTV